MSTPRAPRPRARARSYPARRGCSADGVARRGNTGGVAARRRGGEHLDGHVLAHAHAFALLNLNGTTRRKTRQLILSEVAEHRRRWRARLVERDGHTRVEGQLAAAAPLSVNVGGEVGFEGAGATECLHRAGSVGCRGDARRGDGGAGARTLSPCTSTSLMTRTRSPCARHRACVRLHTPATRECPVRGARIAGTSATAPSQHSGCISPTRRADEIV